MIPILHHNNAGSINIKNFNRRQKWDFFFTSLPIDNWFEANGRSYDDIWSIKVRKVDNFFLFRKNFDSNSKEIILIVLVFFNFLFVLDNPLIKISLFLFFSFSLNLYSLWNFLIFHELLFNVIKNCFSITNIRREDEIFGIGESFWFFIWLKGLKTTFLMLIHMVDDNFSKIFNRLFFIIFYMNIIDVVSNNLLGSVIFINLLIFALFDHLRS